ncbi:MAG: SEC-C metal-binding domain-containing protein [Chromatiales bacterium]
MTTPRNPPEEGHVHGPHCRHDRDHGSAPPACNAHRNVGRNDPCPCGSGRKFKKCHGKDASPPLQDGHER